tara:strand:- start:248 stop:433 length:186 start_codon:yes stop_codon:yes gene_type:complete
MRRGKGIDTESYIRIRIEQLREDMDKAHDQYDRRWYNRLIQELKWAASSKHNCYMEEESVG